MGGIGRNLMPVAMLMAAAACTGGAMCGSGGADNGAAIVVDADSLVAGVEKYAGMRVETCGTIIHVCGVDGKKMKLKTAGDARIRIVPGGAMAGFDKDAFGMKKIMVRGVVMETRIDENHIAKMEEDRSVLCHVDYTPCIDEAWIAELRAAGKADSVSIRATGRLRDKLKMSGKGYYSVVTIVADSCEVTDNAEE